MTFDEIIALIPEDKRTMVKTELDKVKTDLTKFEGAVKIVTREDADKLIKENPLVKASLDAEVSRAVLAHDTKFQQEKLPGIVEAKLREANPPKSPAEIESAKLRSEVEQLKLENARDKQRVRVIGKLSELGLDANMADLFIGTTNEETDAKFSNLFVPAFESARQKFVETKIKDVLGNGTPPQGGSPVKPADLLSQLEKAMADGNADLALALQGRIQTLGSKV